MKRRSKLKSPFVVTMGAFASVSALACGGNTNEDHPGGGGTAGTGATGGSGGGPGGTGGVGATGGGGSGGSGGVIIEGGIPCPAEIPTGYTQCYQEGQGCTYDVACQSGTVTQTFSCNSYGYWTLGVHPPCAHPFDSCPGTELYCYGDTGWSMPEGTNPPTPCPATLPAEGAECYSGGFGGVYENCGYACGPSGSGWQVANCPYNEAGSHWTLGPCE